MNKSFKHIRLPQYRQGDYGYSCATCVHMNPKDVFYCNKYSITIDPGAICNDWEPEFRESKQRKD